MKPLVSILMPAYNAERWIAETIESALRQTWQNKQIIVVDDGSGDETLTIARGFEQFGVIVISQTKQGASAARNTAFGVSKGDYIQWLDADDVLAPDKIERQMQALAPASSKKILVSGAWGRFYHRVNKARFIRGPLWEDLDSLEWLLRKWEYNAYMQTATWLVSRELTEKAGSWDTRLWVDDDGEYFCRVIAASDRIKFVPEARVFYRITGTGRLSYIGHSEVKKEAQLLSMRLQIRRILELKNTKRSRAACITYLQQWLLHFYPERADLVNEARKIASELGGELRLPNLGWKYQWIRKLAGWSVAKRARDYYNRMKSDVLRSCDYLLWRLARQN